MPPDFVSRLRKDLELPQPNEELAAYAHDAWSRWMKHLFRQCKETDKGLLIPDDLVERWTRQMNSPYCVLPEGEKESDRQESQTILRIFVGDDADE